MIQALLLTPGASATRDDRQLVAIDTALAALGIAVERIDLPGTKAGPKIQGTITGAAAALAERAGVAQDRVAVGGRSFGGRMCSMAAADGLPSAGLVLVSYPLHPPGRPAQLRVEHFPRLRVPCLFVSGTRDTFATPAELEAATGAIPGPVTHAWIDGGGHGLGGKERAVADAVIRWVGGLRD